MSTDRSGRSPSGGSPSAASPRGAPRDDTWSEPRVATPSASSPSSRYASRSVPQASASGPIKALKQSTTSDGKSINILVHVKCDKEETRGVSGTIELSSTIAPDRVEIPTLTGVGADVADLFLGQLGLAVAGQVQVIGVDAVAVAAVVAHHLVEVEATVVQPVAVAVRVQVAFVLLTQACIAAGVDRSAPQPTAVARVITSRSL